MCAQVRRCEGRSGGRVGERRTGERVDERPRERQRRKAVSGRPSLEGRRLQYANAMTSNAIFALLSKASAAHRSHIKCFVLSPPRPISVREVAHFTSPLTRELTFLAQTRQTLPLLMRLVDTLTFDSSAQSSKL